MTMRITSKSWWTRIYPDNPWQYSQANPMVFIYVFIVSWMFQVISVISSYLFHTFWANYHISLTWIKTIFGMIPLTFTMIPGFGRSEVVIIYPDTFQDFPSTLPPCCCSRSAVLPAMPAPVARSLPRGTQRWRRGSWAATCRRPWSGSRSVVLRTIRMGWSHGNLCPLGSRPPWLHVLEIEVA